MNSGIITLNHGAGGTVMRKIVRDIFLRHFDNEHLRCLSDAALCNMPGQRLAFTTDSYVVQPLEFAGGDIGKLAICGTVNDLAVMGARPLYLSAGFILEEGLSLERLERIVASMAVTAREAAVEIVTGDTKVVPHGECDSLFINTSGVGVCPEGFGLCREPIAAGDVIIVSGTIGEHSIAILSGRNGLTFESNVASDCAPLNGMLAGVLNRSPDVKWMRDATRGGVAAVLTELCEGRNFGVLIEEDRVPVRREVNAVCELLGFDPLHLANEGKVILAVKRESAPEILDALRRNDYGTHAAVIGEISSEGAGHVRMKTVSGGIRRLQQPAGELLPRIC